MTPPGWFYSTIGQVASSDPRSIAIGPFGSSLRAELYSTSGVPVLRGQDITDGRRLGKDDLVFVPLDVAGRFPACIVRNGDLVFPHRGAIGRVGIVGDQDFLLSSSMMKVSLDRKRVDPDFVFYYFRGPGRDELLSRASTVGTPGIGQPLRSLKGIPICYPGLPEQRAIAELLRALDDKIAANDRIEVLCHTLATAVFERRVAESASTFSRVGDVAKTVLGGTPSRAMDSFWVGGTVPWVNSGKANESRIVEPSEWITEEALRLSAAKLMPVGSTVLAITGATLGQVARLEIAASGNQSLVGIWANDPGLNDWLYFAILREIPALLRAATGAAQQHVNKAAVDSLRIPMIETGALREFHQAVRPLLDQAAAAARQSKQMARARDHLLPLLMSGRLRVGDAEKSTGEGGAR